MPLHRRGVPLVDIREVVDLLRIKLLQHFGDGEAVASGILEHSRGAILSLIHHRRAASPAELARRSPLCAPETADFTANGLPAMDAEIACIPINWLRTIARLANGAHLLAALFPYT